MRYTYITAVQRVSEFRPPIIIQLNKAAGCGGSLPARRFPGSGVARLIFTSQSNEMAPIGRFKIDESRNGRKPVEMFNLIIMGNVFQAWIMTR